MPLRILLADESSSIKKAFQVALSDLGAEIKSVPSGLDVMTVATAFKPHMIFADVLLTKKSGYDVCREIKASNETQHIPVILMWSNFMAFDNTLATQAGYSDRLEKPFDTDALRSIVNKFYKESESHPLKGMLDFPKFSTEQLPEFDEDFTPVQLSHQPTSTPVGSSSSSSQTRSNDTVHIETESHGDFEEVVLVQSNAQRSDAQSKINNQIRNYLENSPTALNKIEKHIQKELNAEVNKQLSQPTQNVSGRLSNRFDENLIREEVRIMTEKICWQIIPDIAERLIKEELEKLMKNIEKSL